MLGSALCELLARIGLWQFVIVDPELLTGGNLSRHTLTLGEVRDLKAVAVGRRLELINPRVSVKSIPNRLEKLSDEQWALLDECDAIIDTTGSDDVIHALAGRTWNRRHFFASVSMAGDAQRLFLFSAAGQNFPTKDFYDWIEPIMEAERKRLGPAPMEGAGCWHPVMPARYDRITTLIGLVCPLIETWLAAPPPFVQKRIIDLPVVK